MCEAVLIRVEIQDFSCRPFQKQSFWSSDRNSCISMFVPYQCDVQPRDNVWEQMCECRTFWAPGWFILQYISVAHVRTGSCPWEYWLKEAITMQSVKPLLSLGILLHEGAELQPSFVCQQDLPFSSFLYFCPVRFFPFFFPYLSISIWVIINSVMIDFSTSPKMHLLVDNIIW